MKNPKLRAFFAGDETDKNKGMKPFFTYSNADGYPQPVTIKINIEPFAAREEASKTSIDNQPNLNAIIKHVIKKYSNLEKHLDNSGEEKYSHLLKVYELGINIIPDEDAKKQKNFAMVRLLHDSVEDGIVSVNLLQRANINEGVLNSIELVTRVKKPYENGGVLDSDDIKILKKSFKAKDEDIKSFDKKSPLFKQLKSYQYHKFVENIINSGDERAILTKYIDTIHNLSDDRMDSLSDAQKQKRIKYFSTIDALDREVSKIIPIKELPQELQKYRNQALENIGLQTKIIMKSTKLISSNDREIC